MITFDEDGLPIGGSIPEALPVPELTLTFQQRLYRALVDLADIVSVNGFFIQPELVQVINKWSTDPPIPPDAEDNLDEVVVGLDQMKLFNAISLQDSNEAKIEENVLKLVKAAEETPDFENMDQIDLIILTQEKELEKNAQGVAYLTACLNQDPQSAHEIIDEQGCTLTHLLTQWFIMYMLTKEEPEGNDSPVTAVRKRVAKMGIETAKAASMPAGQRREAIEEQIEEWKQAYGFYDQNEDPDAPL